MKNINELNSLSTEARALFAEILIDEQVQTSEVEGRDGWEELTDNDLVNSWSDDSGLRLTNVGNQL